MEFNELTTGIAFVAIIALGVGGMIATDMMQTDDVLMMVAPSMIAFGAIMLGIGVKFGEYRATN
ncbi:MULTISPECIES: DUF7333 family protein [Natronorubrum]|uniref:Uncharacterized protein n=2 Tax=Natronorubrum TaxID=134813 RepID=A0A1N7DTH3_9EURY|nr:MULTISPECIES: hypothetical protein [Natronorubrum]APX96157.1 hypothetical protein BB347_05710 [Natronorubrum daqingense]SEH14416.1 hypothetical protein SAMN04487967_1591 [Natronorubrum sediminis]SIR78985.1 hypothetical protein SAMN05421809_2222 [Natronorubrum daqingense]